MKTLLSISILVLLIKVNFPILDSTRSVEIQNAEDKSFNPELYQELFSCNAEAGVISIVDTPSCPGDSLIIQIVGQAQDSILKNVVLLTDTSGLIIKSDSNGHFYNLRPNYYKVFSYNFERNNSLFPVDSISQIDCSIACCDLDSLGIILWVGDTIKPSISCPGDTTIYLPDSSCTDTLILLSPDASDNCGLKTVNNNLGINAGDFIVLTPDTVSVQWTATDSSNLSSSCIQHIIVKDSFPLTLWGCPKDDTLYVSPSNCWKTHLWLAPIAYDNCSARLDSNFSGRPSLHLGLNSFIYYAIDAIDASDDTTICQFTFTLNDTVRPTIRCPSDSILAANSNCEANWSWLSFILAVDNCPRISTISTIPVSGTSLGLGIHTISAFVTDSTGNQGSCQFNVTVVDTMPPVMSNCSTLVFDLASDSCDKHINWLHTFTDNCDPAPQITYLPSLDTLYPLGNHQISVHLQDSAGNVDSSCVFTLVIRDNHSPVFHSCPQDTVLNILPDSCSLPVTWSQPIVSDNCSHSLVTTPVSGSVFQVGRTRVVSTATDPSSNISRCSFWVEIKDTIAPVFSNCPTFIQIPNDSSRCGANYSWPYLTIIENCTYTDICTPPQGSFFPVGNTQVVCTVTDSSGNQDHCQFQIKVTDNEAPVFSVCPRDTMIFATNQNCDRYHCWNVQVVDNCGVDSLVWRVNNSSFRQTTQTSFCKTFTIGSNLMQYQAFDAAGNKKECLFRIRIIDNLKPHFTDFPGDTTIFLHPDSCFVTYNWLFPEAEDNCGNVTIIPPSISPPHRFSIGKYTLTYTARDWLNLDTTQAFTIEVIDTVGPRFINCLDSIVVFVESGQCSKIVSWDSLLIEENCGILDFSCTHSPGDTFPIGLSIVYCVAIDSSDNKDSCIFDIRVEDNEAPIILNCHRREIFADLAGCKLKTSSIPLFETEDNCGVTSQEFIPVGPYPEGENQILLIVKDSSGNESTCEFKLEVKNTVSFQVQSSYRLCRGDSVQFNAVGASAYQWEPMLYLDANNIANPISKPRNPITYQVTGFDQYCQQQKNVTLQVYAALTTQLDIWDSTLCLGDSTYLSAAGGVSYSWSNGFLGNYQWVAPSQNTSYTVRAYDSMGLCDGGDKSVNVQVFSLPFTDFTPNPSFGNDPLYVQFHNTSIGAIRYEWFWLNRYQSNERNPVFTFKDTGTFSIKLVTIGPNDCMTEVEKIVRVDKRIFYLPNAFSPNGDNHNDEFFIPISGYRSFNLIILNRWGKVMFQTNDFSQKWDGKYKGSHVPEAVYFFSLKLIDYNGQIDEKMGSIILFR